MRVCERTTITISAPIRLLVAANSSAVSGRMPTLATIATIATVIVRNIWVVCTTITVRVCLIENRKIVRVAICNSL